MLISAEHLSINFGARQLLDNVDLYLNEGDKVGIVGVNGAGKSTFLRVLAGQLEPDGGTVRRDPNVQVSFLPQNPQMDENATVLEQVFLSFPAEFRALNEYEAKAMLSRLGIADTAQRIGTLSGGQRKRVALAAALIHPADVLILDEPTNHLDTEMVTWLEERLRKWTGGLIMVTHDRYFLERAANHITELDHAKLYHYEANYSRYLELKAQRAEMAQAGERKRQAILRTEREWIMRGCRARTTKSRDRIERYEALRDQAAPETDAAVQLTASSSRLGKKIIELNDVSKSFDGRSVLSHFSYGVLRDDRIGIVGRNGAGKSTLLNLIAGRLEPDSGTVDVGSTVRLGYFSQEGRELDLTQRVYDFIRGISDAVKTEEGVLSAKDMMERFLFPPELQSVPIGKLSGGERRRLYLLSVLMSAPNVLLLDEPTNDLDVTTLSILEDYLDTFPGPVLAVSHDRFFLDKLAGQIFAVEGNGAVERYTGNWSDYARKRREQAAPPPAEKPEREDTRRPREKKLKFTFKEQREFETIDGELAELEAALKENADAMSVCGSDYVRLQELTERQDELNAQMEERTERWMYLNELKERIDAQS